MCGIFAILGSKKSISDASEWAGTAASKLSHRGPDWSGLKVFKYGKNLSYAIAHESIANYRPTGWRTTHCGSREFENLIN